MTRRPTRMALVLTAAVAAIAPAVVAAVPAQATATGRHFSRVTTTDFADPGFAKFGSFYYIYKTGRGFGNKLSVYPNRQYGPTHTSMPNVPSWVDTAHGSAKLWAPHVYAVSSYKGKPLYVMYFTGKKKNWGAACVGTAYSRYPDRGFVATSTVVCGSSNYYEAIDPSAYRAADGKRYMLYKVNHANVSGFTIRAIEMNSTTGLGTVGRSKAKITPGSRMEAPVAIRHGGRVFIFTSRGNYADCTYSTDVWSASSFWTGSFHRVRTLMTSRSTGLCGPGGATVINDGKTTRIAFHAWKSGTPSTHVRQTYVGVVKWTSSNVPYLY